MSTDKEPCVVCGATNAPINKDTGRCLYCALKENYNGEKKNEGEERRRNHQAGDWPDDSA